MLELWNSYSPSTKAGLVVAAAILTHVILRMFVLRSLERLAGKTSNDLDDRLVEFGKQFMGIVLLFLTVLGVLHVFGIQVTPLLAGAGIAGIALGFAAKETLSDVLAGIFLIADRPMRLGDRVKIEFIGKHWSAWGDVIDIGLRRTIVRNTDGVIVNYPNHLLANSVITNFSAESDPVRVRVRFTVGEEADLELAEQLSLEAVAGTDGVLPGTAEIVVRSLWDDTGGHMLGGVLLEGRYRIENVRERTRVRSRVLKRIQVALRDGKIPRAAARVDIGGHAA